MSKALVIKGANFLANAIEQITVTTPVECTGISLNQSTLTFTSIGTTATLTATLTPSDTTEALTWVSSDESVVTVSGGTVTCVGLGSATITATCGTQVATCTVTSTVVMMFSDLSIMNGEIFTSTDLANGKDYVNNYSTTRGRLIYDSSNPCEGYPLFVNTDATYDSVYPIELPANATHYAITYGSAWSSQRGIVFVNANEAYTYSLGGFRQSCRAYSDVIINVEEGDIPEGANAFACYLFGASGTTASEVTDTTSKITFS